MAIEKTITSPTFKDTSYHVVLSTNLDRLNKLCHVEVASYIDEKSRRVSRPLRAELSFTNPKALDKEGNPKVTIIPAETSLPDNEKGKLGLSTPVRRTNFSFAYTTDPTITDIYEQVLKRPEFTGGIEV